MLHIGNISLALPVISAPLAGISDIAFRTINRQYGCQLAFTEMVSCCGLTFKSRQTKEMLATDADDRLLGLQLVSPNIEYMKRALDMLLARPYHFDVLDLNAACPVKKVVRSGAGAALLRDSGKLAELLKVMVRLSPVPVTVKLRIGWDAEDQTIGDIARCAHDCGVSAIFVHGRTKAQKYSGAVDYEAIALVKKSVSIPVIASGDIFGAAHIKRMMDATGCDGVLAARGALGNPWIFKEAQAFFSDTIFMPPALDEIIAVMKKHFQMHLQLYGARIGVLNFRKFFAWYTKGMPHVRPLRLKVFLMTAVEDIYTAIDSLRHIEYVQTSLTEPGPVLE